MATNWNNAIWLAVRQMRDNWTSYLYTAVYFAFMGLVLANDSFWAVEFAVPVLMFILIQPSLSPRYMTYREDNDVTRHQMFLHTLPVSFDTIIRARVIAMLVAGVINVPLLFIPFWFFDPEWSSFVNYLAWCVFWIGIALVGTWVALAQEFWLPFKVWTKTNLISVIAVTLVLFFVIWLTDIRPYSWSIRAANENPWILAVTGLLVSIVGLRFGMVAAVHGFRKREFAL